jgi:hypothetical protein
VKVDDGIDKLNAAMQRLETDQGRIARRNARRAFLYAMKCLRKGLDEEYPNIPKEVVRRRKPDPKRAVRKKVSVSQQTHRELMAAGVSPAQFVERGKAGDATHKIYAPHWMAQAFYADIDPRAIAKAVRSMKTRRRILGMLRLGLNRKKQ